MPIPNRGRPITISTTQNSLLIAGDGVNTVFNFFFVGDSSSVLQVTYINSSGVESVLTPSQYSISLNAPLPNQLWGVGGTLTYPLVGSAILAGTYLLIERILPLTQQISIQNQGNNYPQVVERALDILEMQIQQVAAAASSGGITTPPAIYICGPVGGSANTLTVSTTYPANFTLNKGILVTFIATSTNTGTATLNVEDTGAITIQKQTYSGPANLVFGDMPAGLPVIAQYTGTTWLAFNIVPVGYETTVSTNQVISFANNLTPYVATAPCTFTIASSLTLLSYWYIDIYAEGGAVTIAIDAADKLNNGSAGVGLVMPIGSSGRLITDANGNLYLTGTAAYTVPISKGGTGAVTAAGALVNLGAFGIVNKQRFTSSGTYTPTANMIYCIVRAVGGGGGGGGTSTGAVNYGAGSGGGGEYAESLFTAAQIGASKAVVIATPAAVGGNTSGTSGTAGGDTTFGLTLLVAKGGAGGSGNTTTAPANGGLGGTGGTGDLLIAGQGGGCGTNVASTYAFVGAAGATPFGYAGREFSISGGSTGATPPVESYGSGGGGAFGSAGSGQNGGTANKGYLEVLEFIA